MTISSSLNAGVAGLQSNATRLATISDNIANSSTYGYKRVTADFNSMVISSQGGSYSAGGVRATTQRLIDERGSLVSTANPTDLAVRGRGFLPVSRESEIAVANGAPQMLLATTGSFRTDANGYLVSASGLVLMGWPANPDETIPNFPRDTSDGLEPVQINVNEFSSEPTTQISLGLNLPATETDPGSSGDSQNLSVEYFDNLGTSESIDVEFSPTLPATATDPSTNEWTMTLRDSASVPPNQIIGQFTLTFNNSQTDGGTLDSVAPVAGSINAGYGAADLYDPNTGRFAIYVGETHTAGAPPTSTNANRVEIDIGALGAADGGITQLSDQFAPVAIRKDGTPVGNMTNVEVDPNGFVTAFFDTGISRRVYQIPLIDLPNPNGMFALDQQTYLPSAESGTFFLWDAGDGPTGDVVSYAREESTVDVAGELTDMIQTQRAYSSNAKVIQTVDEMLQETTNIKR